MECEAMGIGHSVLGGAVPVCSIRQKGESGRGTNRNSDSGTDGNTRANRNTRTNRNPGTDRNTKADRKPGANKGTIGDPGTGTDESTGYNGDTEKYPSPDPGSTRNLSENDAGSDKNSGTVL